MTCFGWNFSKVLLVFFQNAVDMLFFLQVHTRFRQFLKDVSKIPLSVNESEISEKNEVTIFDDSDKINVNDFLETMMSDPGPQSLSWLLVLHRIANSENFKHNTTCAYCK